MKKDVFEPFSQKGNSLEATPSEQAWNRLEQKLDRHVEVRRKKRREIFNLNVYWIAATVIGLLAITSISVFIVKNQQDHTIANLTQSRNEPELAPQKDATAGTPPSTTATLNPVAADQPVATKGKSENSQVSAKTVSIDQVNDADQKPQTTAGSMDALPTNESAKNALPEVALTDAEQPRSSPASARLPVDNPLKAAKEEVAKSNIAPSLIGTWLDIAGNAVLEITERSVLYERKNVIQWTRSSADGLAFATDEVSCSIKVVREPNIEITVTNLKSGLAQKKLLRRK